jgi:hypothetical protein
MQVVWETKPRHRNVSHISGTETMESLFFFFFTSMYRWLLQSLSISTESYTFFFNFGEAIEQKKKRITKPRAAEAADTKTH